MATQQDPYGFLDGPVAPGTDTASTDTDTVAGLSIPKLKEAIFGQESGGNYDAVNPDSGATGKYQVMPFNIGPWTRKHLGRELTPDQFRKDPDAQERVAEAQLREYAAKRNGDLASIAKDWYGWGNPGAGYPSPGAYAASIQDRYAKATGQVPPKSSSGTDAAPAAAAADDPYSFLDGAGTAAGSDAAAPGPVAQPAQQARRQRKAVEAQNPIGNAILAGTDKVLEAFGVKATPQPKPRPQRNVDKINALVKPGAPVNPEWDPNRPELSKAYTVRTSARVAAQAKAAADAATDPNVKAQLTDHANRMSQLAYEAQQEAQIAQARLDQAAAEYTRQGNFPAADALTKDPKAMDAAIARVHNERVNPTADLTWGKVVGDFINKGGFGAGTGALDAAAAGLAKVGQANREFNVAETNDAAAAKLYGKGKGSFADVYKYMDVTGISQLFTAAKKAYEDHGGEVPHWLNVAEDPESFASDFLAGITGISNVDQVAEAARVNRLMANDPRVQELRKTRETAAQRGDTKTVQGIDAELESITASVVDPQLKREGREGTADRYWSSMIPSVLGGTAPYMVSGFAGNPGGALFSAYIGYTQGKARELGEQPGVDSFGDPIRTNPEGTGHAGDLAQESRINWSTLDSTLQDVVGRGTEFAASKATSRLTPASSAIISRFLGGGGGEVTGQFASDVTKNIAAGKRIGDKWDWSGLDQYLIAFGAGALLEGRPADTVFVVDRKGGQVARIGFHGADVSNIGDVDIPVNAHVFNAEALLPEGKSFQDVFATKGLGIFGDKGKVNAALNTRIEEGHGGDVESDAAKRQAITAEGPEAAIQRSEALLGTIAAVQEGLQATLGDESLTAVEKVAGPSQATQARIRDAVAEVAATVGNGDATREAQVAAIAAQALKGTGLDVAEANKNLAALASETAHYADMARSMAEEPAYKAPKLAEAKIAATVEAGKTRAQVDAATTVHEQAQAAVAQAQTALEQARSAEAQAADAFQQARNNPDVTAAELVKINDAFESAALQTDQAEEALKAAEEDAKTTEKAVAEAEKAHTGAQKAVVDAHKAHADNLAAMAKAQEDAKAGVAVRKAATISDKKAVSAGAETTAKTEVAESVPSGTKEAAVAPAGAENVPAGTEKANKAAKKAAKAQKKAAKAQAIDTTTAAAPTAAAAKGTATSGDVAETALAQLKANKGAGATVAPDGTIPTEGYMVSTESGLEHQVPEGEDEAAAVRAYMQRDDVAAALKKPDAHLGLWRDNGKLFLDVSTRVQDLEAAKALGEEHFQYGIFDLSKKEGDAGYVALQGRATHDRVVTAIAKVFTDLGTHASQEAIDIQAQLLTRIFKSRAEAHGLSYEEMEQRMFKGGIQAALVGRQGLVQTEDGDVHLYQRNLFNGKPLVDVTDADKTRTDVSGIAETFDAAAKSRQLVPLSKVPKAEKATHAKALTRQFVLQTLEDTKQFFTDFLTHSEKFKGLDGEPLTHEGAVSVIRNAVDWYTHGVDRMVDKYSKVFPELATEPQRRKLFTTLIAITSPGDAPARNIKAATKLYSDYRDAGFTGRLPLGDASGFATVEKLVGDNKLQLQVPVVGYGRTGFEGIQKLNNLIDHFGDIDTTLDWLLTEHDHAEVAALAGKGIELPVDSGALHGAWVLAPKVGAFTLNLGGVLSALTPDLWFSRTWNRAQGTLTEFGKADEPRTEAERRLMRQGVKDLSRELVKVWRSDTKAGASMREALGNPRLLSTAETQSLLWYMEQQAWAAQGHQLARSESYDDSADAEVAAWPETQAARIKSRDAVLAAWRSGLVQGQTIDGKTLGDEAQGSPRSYPTLDILGHISSLLSSDTTKLGPVRVYGLQAQYDFLLKEHAAKTGRSVNDIAAEAARRGDPNNPGPMVVEALYQRSTELAEELGGVLARGGNISTDALVEVLANKPEYINHVAGYLMQQRDRLRRGQLTNRDVAKAYLLTMASIRATEQGLGTFDASVARVGLDPQLASINAVDGAAARDFLSEVAGTPRIRPEDAMAKWLFTKDGKAFLDGLEADTAAGRPVNTQALKSAMQLRGLFGGAEKTVGNLLQPSNDTAGFSLDKLQALTEALNEAGPKGADAVGEVAKGIRGIGDGKVGFIKQLLGFGDAATVDAVEINLWLTGKGNIKGIDPQLAALANDVKASKNSAVQGLMRNIVESGFNRLATDPRIKSQLTAADLDPNVFNTVMHHWLWDRAKGSETSHAGFYKAMLYAQQHQDIAGTVNGATIRGPKFQDPAIIALFKSANFSTVLHEGAHVARQWLTDEESSVAQGWVEKVTGVPVTNGIWLESHEEAFARGFEVYLLEGQLPENAPKGLKAIFDKVRDFMAESYRNIMDLLGQVGPLDNDIRGVYASLLGVNTATPLTVTQEHAKDLLRSSTEAYTDVSTTEARDAVEAQLRDNSLNSVFDALTRWQFRLMPIVDQRGLIDDVLQVRNEGLQPVAREQVLGPVIGDLGVNFKTSKIPDDFRAAMQRRMGRRLTQGTAMQVETENDAHEMQELRRFGLAAFNALYPHQQVAQRLPSFMRYVAFYHPELVLQFARADARASGLDLTSKQWLNREASLKELAAAVPARKFTGTYPLYQQGSDDHVPAQNPFRGGEVGPEGLALTHYSRTPGLTALDPAKMGTGVTLSKSERNSQVQRSYFYLEGTAPESVISRNTSTRYRASLPAGTRIYDLSTDPDGIIAAAKAANNGVYNPDIALGLIRNSGYQGYMAANSGQMGNVVAMFGSVPVEEVDFTTGQPQSARLLFQTRDLMAVHEVSVSDIDGIFKLGGLVGPSVGIVDSKVARTGFGQVALILRKEHIDPENGVELFIHDAYTPRFPRITEGDGYINETQLARAAKEFGPDGPHPDAKLVWPGAIARHLVQQEINALPDSLKGAERNNAVAALTQDVAIRVARAYYGDTVADAIPKYAKDTAFVDLAATPENRAYLAYVAKAPEAQNALDNDLFGVHTRSGWLLGSEQQLHNLDAVIVADGTEVAEPVPMDEQELGSLLPQVMLATMQNAHDPHSALLRILETQIKAAYPLDMQAILGKVRSAIQFALDPANKRRLNSVSFLAIPAKQRLLALGTVTGTEASAAQAFGRRVIESEVGPSQSIIDKTGKPVTPENLLEAMFTDSDGQPLENLRRREGDTRTQPEAERWRYWDEDNAETLYNRLVPRVQSIEDLHRRIESVDTKGRDEALHSNIVYYLHDMKRVWAGAVRNAPDRDGITENIGIEIFRYLDGRVDTKEFGKRIESALSDQGVAEGDLDQFYAAAVQVRQLLAQEAPYLDKQGHYAEAKPRQFIPLSQIAGVITAMSSIAERFKEAGVQVLPNTNDTTELKTKLQGMQNVLFQAQQPKAGPKLVAVHNLNPRDLEGILDIGGFAGPSIAVVEAEKPYTQFGDITVVFKKHHVDPEIPDNADLFIHDAWTPRFPELTVHRIGPKAVERIAATGFKQGDTLPGSQRWYHALLAHQLGDNYEPTAAQLNDGIVKTVTTALGPSAGRAAQWLVDLGGGVESSGEQGKEVPFADRVPWQAQSFLDNLTAYPSLLAYMGKSRANFDALMDTEIYQTQPVRRDTLDSLEAELLKRYPDLAGQRISEKPRSHELLEKAARFLVPAKDLAFHLKSKKVLAALAAGASLTKNALPMTMWDTPERALSTLQAIEDIRKGAESLRDEVATKHDYGTQVALSRLSGLAMGHNWFQVGYVRMEAENGKPGKVIADTGKPVTPDNLLEAMFTDEDGNPMRNLRRREGADREPDAVRLEEWQFMSDKELLKNVFLPQAANIEDLRSRIASGRKPNENLLLGLVANLKKAAQDLQRSGVTKPVTEDMVDMLRLGQVTQAYMEHRASYEQVAQYANNDKAYMAAVDQLQLALDREAPHTGAGGYTEAKSRRFIPIEDVAGVFGSVPGELAAQLSRAGVKVFNATREAEDWQVAMSKLSHVLFQVNAQTKQEVLQSMQMHQRAAQSLAQAYLAQQAAHWTEVLADVRKAGLLSSPRTHLGNIIGNSAFQLMEEASTLPSAMLDALLSLRFKEGRSTKFRPDDFVRAFGHMMSLRDGLAVWEQGGVTRFVNEVFHGGNTAGSQVGRGGWGYSSKAMQTLEGVTQITFRLLQAEDAVFNAFAMRRSLLDQGRAAVSRGEVADLKAFFAGVDETHLDIAMADALFATFNNGNLASDELQTLKTKLRLGGFMGKSIKLAIDMLVPFDRTPTNLFLRFVDYSPLGLVAGSGTRAYGEQEIPSGLLGKYKAAKEIEAKRLASAAGYDARALRLLQREMSKQVGRGVVGTVLLMAAGMAAGNLLSGAGSLEDKRRRGGKTGRQPNSIKLFGRWWSLNRLQPLSSIMALGATIGESWKAGEPWPELADAAYHAALQQVLQLPMARGFSDLGNVLSEKDASENKTSYFLGSMATSFIPSISRDIAEFMDNGQQRQAKTPLEMVKRNIPGPTRESLPLKRDTAGNVVKRNRWQSLVDPFNSTPAKANPVYDELGRFGIVVNPSKQLPGETPDAYQARLAHRDQVLEENLQEVISRDTYRAGVGKKTSQGKDWQKAWLQKVVRNTVMALNSEERDQGIRTKEAADTFPK